MPNRCKTLAVALALALACHAASAQFDGECSLDLRNAFGPFDYRTASEDQRRLVEHAHFTSQVESLTRGASTTMIGADIAYTLRAFPNHARALRAMAKLARREKKPTPAGARFPVECWFERAIAFQPDDAQVRLVYGIELLTQERRDAAIEQLKLADELGGDDPNVAYNLGLAYFDLNQHETAMSYARKAYQQGFPLPGLREKLTRAGAWKP